MTHDSAREVIARADPATIGDVSMSVEAEFRTLREANVHRQSLWDAGNQITLAYRGNEMAGEVGEACNVIKKIERERLGIRGSRATLEQLAEELADVVICADLIAMGEGIDLLGKAVPDKFNATSEKVGLPTRLSRHPEPLHQAADTIARLRERVAKLEARLEIDHCFEHRAGSGELVRVEIPPAERDNWPDGIECRDETIKLLKEHKDELKAELSSLKAAGTRADGIEVAAALLAEGAGNADSEDAAAILDDAAYSIHALSPAPEARPVVGDIVKWLSTQTPDGYQDNEFGGRSPRWPSAQEWADRIASRFGKEGG